jgi:hypothetical protein
MNAIAQAAIRELARREILARQGLRLPAVTLKHLQRASIYCQPTISIEYQHLARKWVLRGLESGGAAEDLGAYTSFVGADGIALSWLQKVDSIGVNAVHAVAIAPVMLRLQMIRIGRTYDLFITRHTLTNMDGNRRPRLESSIIFYGRRGTLELELWGKDAGFRGAVCPVFYSRSGEVLTVPPELGWAIASLTAAVCCVGCRHCHLLEPARLKADIRPSPQV